MQPQHTTLLPETKRCSKCGETKPLDAFYFEKKTSDGRGRWCKVCIRAYQVANKKRIAEYAKSYQEANKDHIAEYARAYYAENKERIAEYQRGWNDANKEYKAERSHVYYLRTKEYQAAKRRAYYAANKNRESKRTGAWAIANRPARQATLHLYRARKRHAEGSHTAVDIRAQYDRQHGRCYYCDAKIGNNYHVDHIVPLSRGGSNWPENLVITCPTCNTSKGDKLPHEWIGGGRLI